MISDRFLPALSRNRAPRPLSFRERNKPAPRPKLAPPLLAALLLLCLAFHPASAQTLGGSCSGSPYSSDQISIVKNNVAVCNTSSVWQSLLGAPAGDPNDSIALGANSLGSITTGTHNTALGVGALQLNTTGTDSTAVGFGALNQAIGSPNDALGYEAGEYITTGTNNIAIGYLAMQGTSANPLTGGTNVAVGGGALTAIQGAAQSNTAIGYEALYSNTTGYNNTAVGTFALLKNTTAYANTAYGSGTLSTVTTGFQNTAYGNAALGSTTGENNTAVGTYAGLSDVSGNFNIFIGENGNITTGNSNILIANTTATANNQLDIGDVITGTGLGAPSASTITIAGALQISGAASGPAFLTTSDARIKTNITPLENGLAGIAALTGVTYTYRPPAEREIGKELNLPVGKRQMGVIAQNVEQVFPEAVETMGTTGLKSVNYNMLMAPMIEAVKTLNRRIDALMAAVAFLYAGLAVVFLMQIRQLRTR